MTSDAMRDAVRGLTVPQYAAMHNQATEARRRVKRDLEAVGLTELAEGFDVPERIGDDGDVTTIVQPACGVVALTKAIADHEKGGGAIIAWTASQRALLGARACRSTHGGNRRPAEGLRFYMDKEGHAVIAATVGVSVRQLRAAIRLLRTENAEPLIEAVGSGLISVHDALFAVSTVTPETYGKAVERVRSGDYRTIRALVDDL
jgi:hypothetical protein